MTILRTRNEGVWELRSNAWGQFLAPTADPLADTVITQQQLDGFELHPDTPLIPAELWNRWIELCIELCKRGTGDLEVSCRLVRSIADPSQYRIFIPVQKVTGTSVRVESFDKAVDIETGELVEQWPPEGWRPCGSSHSHNTMAAFFSGTDDQYELGDPGLHIVVGKINVTTGAYELTASITANHRRFIIEPSVVVDYGLSTDTTYAPKCLDVISLPAVKPVSKLPKADWGSFTYDTAPPAGNPIPANLQSEVDRIRSAINNIIVYGDVNQVDVHSILNEIVDEIDETTMFATTFNDPFYWNDDLPTKL